MSKTESLGMADATRWIGVAAYMVDYLDDWRQSLNPPPLRGIFAGARRFFLYALEGVALDRNQRFALEIPIMAGVCNLGIFMDVLRRFDSPKNLDEVEEKIRNYLESLDKIEKDNIYSPEFLTRVEDLRMFFQLLQEQGNHVRHNNRNW